MPAHFSPQALIVFCAVVGLVAITIIGYLELGTSVDNSIEKPKEVKTISSHRTVINVAPHDPVNNETGIASPTIDTGVASIVILQARAVEFDILWRQDKEWFTLPSQIRICMRVRYPYSSPDDYATVRQLCLEQFPR